MRMSSLVATFAVAATICTTIAAAQSRIPVQAGYVAYGIGKWDTDSLGNHRVVVHVDAMQNGDLAAVRVHIPWRRRDEDPQNKNIIVLNAQTGGRITNVARIDISREFGDIAFQPTAPGDYYVYFMPFRRTNKSANYPKIVYQSPDSTADAAWLIREHLSSAELASGAWRALPVAHVAAYQAGDSLDAFTPMEIIATHRETEALLAQNANAAYLVFPENRANSIRMATDIPKRWIDAGADAPFKGVADRGEFYVFQIGVFATRQNLANVRTVFSNLRSANGSEISASRIQCFNTGGINWLGKPFTHVVAVAQGHVQPLWIGVDLSSSTPQGDYIGTVTVTPDNAPPTEVRVTLHVTSTVVPVHGDDDLSRLSRLRWLNSRLAEDNSIVPPFTPVVRRGDTVSVLGRSVIVGQTGFPSHILSRFTDGNTRIGTSAHDIITAPVAIVVDAGTSPIIWHTRKPQFVAQAPGAMEWSTVNNSTNGLLMKVHARLEFDGNIEYQVALSSTSSIPVRDIRIEVPYAADASL
ncbi:MAG: glycoside hydrolase domain-containing protein, partial [Gemmatimonadaceae bacterium]